MCAHKDNPGGSLCQSVLIHGHCEDRQHDLHGGIHGTTVIIPWVIPTRVGIEGIIVPTQIGTKALLLWGQCVIHREPVDMPGVVT